MIWFVWRIHRTQVLSSVGVVAALIAVWLVVLWEVSGCQELRGCDAPVTAFAAENYVYYGIGVLLLAVILGVFAGGPLFAREFEERTYAFVITQRGHHGRWVLLKLLVSAVPVGAAVTVLGVLAAHAHERAGMPLRLLQQLGYVANGPLLGAWFLLAFGFAAVAGVIGRKTLLAMVIGAVAVAPAGIAVSQLVRPVLLLPERIVMDITQTDRDTAEYLPVPDNPDRTTIIESGYLTATGTELDYAICADPACQNEVAESYTDYYHDDDFWTLQLFDIAGYTLLAGTALAITTQRLNQRRL